jgi:hypothetical protein
MTQNWIECTAPIDAAIQRIFRTAALLDRIRSVNYARAACDPALELKTILFSCHIHRVPSGRKRGYIVSAESYQFQYHFPIVWQPAKRNDLSGCVTRAAAVLKYIQKILNGSAKVITSYRRNQWQQHSRYNRTALAAAGMDANSGSILKAKKTVRGALSSAGEAGHIAAVQTRSDFRDLPKRREMIDLVGDSPSAGRRSQKGQFIEHSYTNSEGTRAFNTR